MNPLALPLLPLRIAAQALDDLHTLAVAARDVQTRADRVESVLVELLELGRRVDRTGVEMLEMARTIDDRAEAVLALGERIDIRGAAIVEEGHALRASASEVTARAGQVLEALPLLERAVAMAEPLEGAVERLGRVADRLPGGRPRRAPDAPPGP